MKKTFCTILEFFKRTFTLKLNVRTSRGQVHVKKLKPRQVVIGQTRGATVFNRVTKIEKGSQKLDNKETFYCINNETILAGNQSIFVGKRIIHVKDLKIGQRLSCFGNTRLKVSSISEFRAINLLLFSVYFNTKPFRLVFFWKLPTVRLKVSGSHTYYINDILVHNPSRYWVGGGASVNWTATGNTNFGSASNTRDNASVPSSSDAVIFDNSANGNSACTLNAAAVCASITFAGDGAGAYANTFTHNNNITITVSGSITLVSGMGYTLGGTGSTWAMNGTGNLDTGTKTIGGLTVNIGGAMTLSAGVTMTGNFTKSASGTFTHNNQTVTMTGTGTQTINGAATFYNLARVATSGMGQVLSLATNFTVTNEWTLTGSSSTNRLLVASNTAGTQRTITNTGATMTWSNVDFKDIGLSTAYDASAITGGSGNCGNNTNITFTTAQTPWYFKATTDNGTADNYYWSQYQNWYTATNGGGTQMASTRVPLAQDSFTFDAASFAATSVVTTNMQRLGTNIDWSGIDQTVTWNINNGNFGGFTFGSLALASTVSMTGTFGLTMYGSGNITFTSNSSTVAAPVQFWAKGYTTTLVDAFSSTKQIINQDTELITGGNSVTCTTYSSATTTAKLTMSSTTLTLTGSGTSTWAHSNGTLTANTGTIKFTDTTSATVGFVGGSKTTYNIVWFARGASTGNCTIAGNNTGVQLKDTGTAAHSLTHQNGQTFTLTGASPFEVSGSSGNAITINTTTGTAVHTYSFTNAAPVVSCDWLNIQHSVVTQADVAYAGANSVDNNSVATAGSGWIFTVPPSGSLSISITDQLNLTESTALTLVSDISTSDQLTVSESTALTLVSDISTSDQLTVSESTALTLVSDISTSDQLTVSESTALTIVSDISTSDQLTVSESTALTLVSDILTSDQLTVSESITVTVVTGLSISIFDQLTVSESTALTLVSDISTSDQLTLTESVSASITSFVSLSDQLDITENIGITLVQDISIFDQVTISESVSGTQVLTISTNDYLTVSENTVFTGENFISIYDQVTLSESIQLTLILDLIISDQITITENIDKIVSDPTRGFTRLRGLDQTNPVTMNESVDYTMQGRDQDYPLGMGKI